jgi:membrane protein YdbS with pleckstrin-like domain
MVVNSYDRQYDRDDEPLYRVDPANGYFCQTEATGSLQSVITATILFVVLVVSVAFVWGLNTLFALFVPEWLAFSLVLAVGVVFVGVSIACVNWMYEWWRYRFS